MPIIMPGKRFQDSGGLTGTFTDDFNRTTLGTDWTEEHYNGSGSVTLDGSTVEVDAAGSGDFWDSNDGGSLIYRNTNCSDFTSKVKLVNSTFDSAGFTRLFMLRSSNVSNAAFQSLAFDDGYTHITRISRSSTGAHGDYLGDNTGYNWSGSFPVWLRFDYNDPNLTLEVSEDDSTWNLVDTVNHSGLLLICLPASLQGVNTFDDFEFNCRE